MVHAVTVRDLPIEYQIYGDKIYADTSPTDVVIADYTYRGKTKKTRPRTSRLLLSMHWQPCLLTSIAQRLRLSVIDETGCNRSNGKGS